MACDERLADRIALSRPHAREMDFTGRALRGMVYVAPEGLTTARRLGEWIDRGATSARSLPPKPAPKGPNQRRRR